MPVTRLSASIDWFRRSIAPEAEPDRSDGEWLSSFVADRDPTAFSHLVRRHGPMVLSVCRRITGHAHDAEDAFQAVFLVLARRAAVVNPPEAVGNWLYGVAVRTAREARSAAARRYARERPTDRLPDPGRLDPEPFAVDPFAALDEELACLPDKYRALVVLCDLEGESQVALARRLGLPVGTVYSRLATARALLGKRLRGRGLALAAALPAGLAISSARLPAVSASPAPRITALAEVVMRTAVGWKWKFVPIVALVALAVGLLTGRSPDRSAGWDILPGSVARAAPVNAPKPRTGEILVWKAGHAVLLRPDGTTAREWKGEQVPESYAARLSPDGRTIAVLRSHDTRQSKENVPGPNGAMFQGNFRWHLYRLTLYPVADKLTGVDREVPGGTAIDLHWLPDGRQVFVATHDEDGTYKTNLARMNLCYYAVDVKTGRHTPLKLPAGHHLHDVSADGRRFLTSGDDPKQEGNCVFLVPAEEGKAERLTDEPESPYNAVFSPDGTRVLMCGAAGVPAGPGPVPPPLKVEPWFDVVTLADRKRVPAAPLEANEFVMCCRYSPDGKQVVSLRHTKPQPDKPLGWTVIVAGVDGKNAKTVFKIGGEERVLIDWR